MGDISFELRGGETWRAPWEDYRRLRDESPVHFVPAAGDTPDATAIRSQNASVLQEALARLPEDQRTAIILKEYHGLKFREIAEILETPESTVKSRLYHGLESLAKSLGHLNTQGQTT